MNKSIVRTPTRAEGGITAEEKKSLDEHAKLWIERIMKTGYVDKRKITAAIKGLYRVSGKKEPKVIIVPSPYVGQLAGGLAAAILYLRHPAAIDAATDAATRAATDAATDQATAAATYRATSAATDQATAAATYDATAAATRAATDDATAAATRAATRDATDDATRAATDAAIAAATDAATEAATYAVTYRATRDETYRATDQATAAATYAATYRATRDAIDDATSDATDDATRDATYRATAAATYDATDAATRAATRAATDDAIAAATDTDTRAATEAATYDATYDATYRATSAATRDAIDAATDDATRDATYRATAAATYDATAAATRDAIDAVTDDATRAATDDATRDATDDAIAAATQLLNVIAHFLPSTEFNFVLCCINNIWRLRQGGNMWGMWDSYLTAMRDIIGLSGLDCWDRYKYWEEAAIHGGYRIMHEEFCMVSEFPEFIKTNENRQPHSDNGPSHRWRDGFEIYHLNGVRFPKPLYWRVISGNMPMEEILDITDIDQRYQALRYAKSGLREFFLQQSGKKIDEFIKFDIKKRKISYQLWQVPAGEIFNKDVFFAIYDDPSSIEKSNPKEYCKGVPEFSTVAEAMAWGMSSNEYTLSPEDWKRLTPLTEES